MSKVRYRVKGPVFINGSKVVPIPGKDVFVEAAPGLAGKALELADAPAAAERKVAKDSSVIGGQK